MKEIKVLKLVDVVWDSLSNLIDESVNSHIRTVVIENICASVFEVISWPGYTTLKNTMHQKLNETK